MNQYVFVSILNMYCKCPALSDSHVMELSRSVGERGEKVQLVFVLKKMICGWGGIVRSLASAKRP